MIGRGMLLRIEGGDVICYEEPELLEISVDKQGLVFCKPGFSSATWEVLYIKQKIGIDTRNTTVYGCFGWS